MTQLDTDWLKDAATQRVFSMLENAGHQVFAVGGCVRDGLLGRPVSDIDLSTSARPETVAELAKADGLRVIPTGIEHGTVTVMVGNKPFEVTTFRRDIETDGRRAVVAFADGIDDDARRRDFTMNALYCDGRGGVHDPLGGLQDLRGGVVRFIEDAVTRIREDYLRSLRYFRFHAWYGDMSKGLDVGALDAISRNVDGLRGLSRERVGSEVKRLLAAPDPAPAVAGMRSTGVLATILPGADDTSLAILVALEKECEASPDAMRRLAVLGGEDAAAKLRLSRKETERLKVLRGSVGLAAGELGYRMGADLGRDVLLVAAASLQAPINPADLQKVYDSAGLAFPVKAADLMPDLSGPELGSRLKKLEQSWIDSDFTLSRDQLLSLGG